MQSGKKKSAEPPVGGGPVEEGAAARGEEGDRTGVGVDKSLWGGLRFPETGWRYFKYKLGEADRLPGVVVKEGRDLDAQFSAQNRSNLIHRGFKLRGDRNKGKRITYSIPLQDPKTEVLYMGLVIGGEIRVLEYAEFLMGLDLSAEHKAKLAVSPQAEVERMELKHRGERYKKSIPKPVYPKQVVIVTTEAPIETEEFREMKSVKQLTGAKRYSGLPKVFGAFEDWISDRVWAIVDSEQLVKQLSVEKRTELAAKAALGCFLMMRALINGGGIKTDVGDFFNLKQLCDHVLNISDSGLGGLDGFVKAVYTCLKTSPTTNDLKRWIHNPAERKKVKGAVAAEGGQPVASDEPISEQKRPKKRMRTEAGSEDDEDEDDGVLGSDGEGCVVSYSKSVREFMDQCRVLFDVVRCSLIENINKHLADSVEGGALFHPNDIPFNVFIVLECVYNVFKEGIKDQDSLMALGRTRFIPSCFCKVLSETGLFRTSVMGRLIGCFELLSDNHFQFDPRGEYINERLINMFTFMRKKTSLVKLPSHEELLNLVGRYGDPMDDNIYKSGMKKIEEGMAAVERGLTQATGSSEPAKRVPKAKADKGDADYKPGSGVHVKVENQNPDVDTLEGAVLSLSNLITTERRKTQRKRRTEAEMLGIEKIQEQAVCVDVPAENEAVGGGVATDEAAGSGAASGVAAGSVDTGGVAAGGTGVLAVRESRDRKTTKRINLMDLPTSDKKSGRMLRGYAIPGLVGCSDENPVTGVLGPLLRRLDQDEQTHDAFKKNVEQGVTRNCNTGQVSCGDQLNINFTNRCIIPFIKITYLPGQDNVFPHVYAEPSLLVLDNEVKLYNMPVFWTMIKYNGVQEPFLMENTAAAMRRFDKERIRQAFERQAKRPELVFKPPDVPGLISSGKLAPVAGGPPASDAAVGVGAAAGSSIGRAAGGSRRRGGSRRQGGRDRFIVFSDAYAPQTAASVFLEGQGDTGEQGDGVVGRWVDVPPPDVEPGAATGRSLSHHFMIFGLPLPGFKVNSDDIKNAVEYIPSVLHKMVNTPCFLNDCGLPFTYHFQHNPVTGKLHDYRRRLSYNDASSFSKKTTLSGVWIDANAPPKDQASADGGSGTRLRGEEDEVRAIEKLSGYSNTTAYYRLVYIHLHPEECSMGMRSRVRQLHSFVLFPLDTLYSDDVIDIIESLLTCSYQHGRRRLLGPVEVCASSSKWQMDTKAMTFKEMLSGIREPTLWNTSRGFLGKFLANTHGLNAKNIRVYTIGQLCMNKESPFKHEDGMCALGVDGLEETMNSLASRGVLKGTSRPFMADLMGANAPLCHCLLKRPVDESVKYEWKLISEASHTEASMNVTVDGVSPGFVFAQNERTGVLKSIPPFVPK